MVGICGQIGERSYDIDSFAEQLKYYPDENVTTFRGDDVSVGCITHSTKPADQPAESEDFLLWVWGAILGHERRGEYTCRPGGVTDAEYCANLYNKFGQSFVAGLNSEFVGIIFDKDEDSVSIFTDRLSSRPIYYTWTNDGCLLFSSQLQSLIMNSDPTVEFDPRFLSEFLHYGRALGIHTPFKNIYQFPPASVVTFDTQGNKIRESTYWWPQPSAHNSSLDTSVSRFTQTFRKIVPEHVPKNQDCGLLLTGGVDSRAVLAASDGELVGLHMNERMEHNKEEWLARESARITGSDFKFLEREGDYYPTILEKSAKITNFNGRFRHARLTYFSDIVRQDIDLLATGHYGDTIADGFFIPWDNSAGKIPIQSPHDYAKAFDTGKVGHPRIHVKPSFLQNLPNPRQVLANQLHKKEDHVTFHGVSYPSWDSFLQFGMTYPITNGYGFLFYESNNQVVPTRYPFLDNRIIDTVHTIPVEHRCAHDLVEEALNQLDADLASVESQYSPSTLTERVEENKYLNHLFNAPPRQLPTDLLKFIGVMDGDVSKPQEQPSYTYKQEGQRPSEDGSIRYDDFVGRSIDKHEESIRKCPYIDHDAVSRQYRAHLDGENHSMELFSLLSLIEAPSFTAVFD